MHLLRPKREDDKFMVMVDFWNGLLRIMIVVKMDRYVIVVSIMTVDK